MTSPAAEPRPSTSSGRIAGIALGLAYTAGRTLLPSSTRLRVIVFTLGTTAFMLGQIVRGNREDFALLPVTLSLLLIVVSVAVTAAPVPLLVERLAPDVERTPGRLARGVVVARHDRRSRCSPSAAS